MYVCMYIYIYIYTYVCMYVCMYVCVYIYIYRYRPHPPVGQSSCCTDHVRDGMGYVACASLGVKWPFRAVLRALPRAVGPSWPILPAIRRLLMALGSDLS